jgi:hypothetical protein
MEAINRVEAAIAVVKPERGSLEGGMLLRTRPPPLK